MYMGMIVKDERAQPALMGFVFQSMDFSAENISLVRSTKDLSFISTNIDKPVRTIYCYVPLYECSTYMKLLWRLNSEAFSKRRTFLRTRNNGRVTNESEGNFQELRILYWDQTLILKIASHPCAKNCIRTQNCRISHAFF